MAFVSLPDAEAVVTGRKVYVTVTAETNGKGGTPEVYDARPGCQAVPVSFPGNGRYRVVIETEVPSPPDEAAGRDCQGGSDAPGIFDVAVPPKETAAGPGTTKAPMPAGGGGRGGTGRTAGGAKSLGSKPLIDVGRFQAEFNQLVERTKGGQPGEEGFGESLPYGNAAERDEELGADEERGARRNALGFMAGGLLALVTFFFLRCLRSEVNRQPLPG
jgi:hypothetical protein